MGSPSPLPFRHMDSISFRGRSTSRSPSWGREGCEEDSAQQCAQWGLTLLAKLKETRAELDQETARNQGQVEQLTTERNQAVARYKDITDKHAAAATANLFLENRVGELETELQDKDDELGALKDQLQRLSQRLRERGHGFESDCGDSIPPSTPAPATPYRSDYGEASPAPALRPGRDVMIQAGPLQRVKAVQCSIVDSEQAEQLLRFVGDDAGDADGLHSGVCAECSMFTLTRLVCPGCYGSLEAMQKTCDEQKQVIRRQRRQLDDELPGFGSPQPCATPSSVASVDKIAGLPPFVRCSPGMLGLQHLSFQDEMRFLDSHDMLIKEEAAARAAAADEEDAARTALREGCFAATFDVLKGHLAGMFTTQEAAARRFIEDQASAGRASLYQALARLCSATHRLRAEHAAASSRAFLAHTTSLVGVEARARRSIMEDHASAIRGMRVEFVSLANAAAARREAGALLVAEGRAREGIAQEFTHELASLSVASCRQSASHVYHQKLDDVQRAAAARITRSQLGMVKDGLAAAAMDETRERLLIARDRDAGLETLKSWEKGASKASARTVHYHAVVAAMHARGTSALQSEEARARLLIVQENDALRRDHVARRVEVRRLVERSRPGPTTGLRRSVQHAAGATRGGDESATTTPRGAQSRVREVFLQKARDRLALKLEKKRVEEIQVRSGARRSVSVEAVAAAAAATAAATPSAQPLGTWVESPTKAVAARLAAADEQLFKTKDGVKVRCDSTSPSEPPLTNARRSLSTLPLNQPLVHSAMKRSLSTSSSRSVTPARSVRSGSHYPPQTPCSHWAYGYDVGDQWIQLRETVLKVSGSMALKISEIQESKDKEGLFKRAHQSLKAVLTRSITREMRPGGSWQLRPEEIERLPRHARSTVLRALRDLVCAYDMMRTPQKDSLLTVREILNNISSLILLARWSQQTSAQFRARSSSPPRQTSPHSRSSSCGIGRHSTYVVSAGANTSVLSNTSGLNISAVSATL